MTRTLATGMILGVALLAAPLGKGADRGSEAGQRRLEREVRRELVTLPFYSLFDHLAFRVDGYHVTLLGKVTRPTMKSTAENVVKKIEGVEKVTNQIEVLPLSSQDDQLRMALYRAIYGHSVLQTLAIRAVPPIHILVDRGNVTLEGVVATEMQKNIAGIQANGVAGVFSVTNNLQVEKNK